MAPVARESQSTEDERLNSYKMPSNEPNEATKGLSEVRSFKRVAPYNCFLSICYGMAILLGEELGQLGCQVGVAGQQLLAVGRLSGVQRLEVGAEDRLEAAPPLRVVGRLLGDRRLIGHRHPSLPSLRIAQVPSVAGRA
jgi:hypothetical protein